jgi:two-component system sensor histidine kinase SenX3
MRFAFRRVAIPSATLGIAAAVPVAISPTWGWLGTAVVAAAGAALISRALASSHVAPLEQMAAIVRGRTGSPDASAADLARLVAFEYRDALAALERAQGESRRREAALKHVGDGVVLVDETGLVDYANPAARALMNERVLDLSHRLDQPDLHRVLRLADGLGSPVEEEVTVHTPAPRHVLARALPLVSGGSALILMDLSESYRLDRVRRDFVANVSHELKTPVAGMRALADVAIAAHHDGDRESAGRFVSKIRDEAERLADLVADLLDLSSVETGGQLDVQALELADIVRSATERVRAVAESKGVALEVGVLPATLAGDATQLTMAVQNLVDNAVRYSERGTVRVASGRDDGCVVITVSDEGIGIPAKELPRIFERFYRVDRARSRATGGTGLGLSIVRHVAENHGGRVEVASELGVGSTFKLVLPAEPVSTPGTAA